MARLSNSRYESKRDANARPSQGHLSLATCSVKAGQGVDARIAERFSDYLRTAMGARLDTGGRNITLEFSPGPQDGFAVNVSESGAQLSGSSTETLMQRCLLDAG